MAETIEDAQEQRWEKYCNAEQYEFVELVARRVIQEMRAEGDGHEIYCEPLRWFLHGGPGTGKTHAVKIVPQLKSCKL